MRTANKFMAIYNDLVEQIQNGKIAENSLLPSEHVRHRLDKFRFVDFSRRHH